MLRQLHSSAWLVTDNSIYGSWRVHRSARHAWASTYPFSGPNSPCCRQSHKHLRSIRKFSVSAAAAHTTGAVAYHGRFRALSMCDKTQRSIIEQSSRGRVHMSPFKSPPDASFVHFTHKLLRLEASRTRQSQSAASPLAGRPLTRGQHNLA